MTQDEYLSRRKSLTEQIKTLEREYKDTAPIKAPCYVMVNGEKKWLKMWKIVDGVLYPCLYNLSKNGKPLCSTYPVSKNQLIEPVNG